MARYLSALLILGFALANAQGAEDEFVILTIDGNLIGPIEPIGDRINSAQEATRLISALPPVTHPCSANRSRLPARADTGIYTRF